MLRETQAVVVDVVKRRAIRALHDTRAGEATLLQTYLWAERGAECAVVEQILATGAPSWLEEELQRHVADEARHARLLSARLGELGAPERTDPPLGLLALRKRRQLEEIVSVWSGRFVAGTLVPLLAIAARMEAMGVRVLERHLAVLSSMRGGDVGPTARTLAAIVGDERRHVAGCERALARLVEADEVASLAQLRDRIGDVERAFGVTSSLGLLALGHALRIFGGRA